MVHKQNLASARLLMISGKWALFHRQAAGRFLSSLLLFWGFWALLGWHLRGCLTIPNDFSRNQPLQVEVKAKKALSKLPSSPQQLVEFWFGGVSTVRSVFSLLSHTEERKWLEDFSRSKNRSVFASGALHTTSWRLYNAVLCMLG